MKKLIAIIIIVVLFNLAGKAVKTMIAENTASAKATAVMLSNASK